MYLYPIMPIPDMFSTIWAISFGGHEMNPIPRFFMLLFGYPEGLILFEIILSLLFFICVKTFEIPARTFKSALNSTTAGYRFVMSFAFFSVLWFIGYWFSVVVLNFLAPLSLTINQTIIIGVVTSLSLLFILLAFTRKQLTLLLRPAR